MSKVCSDISDPVCNILTVDVEEYFHPTEVQRTLPDASWPSLPSLVEGQVSRILDLLDEKDVKATFFILGWVASQRPRLVREISRRGHEIGCHSYSHRLVYELTPSQFRDDTIKAVRAIADACDVEPRIYRAPSYSITRESFWALETLVECGFTHDSSIYPIAHDRYGIAGFARHAHSVLTPAGPIQEIPIATVRLSNGQIAPIGGGAYLRLLPYCYTAAGMRRVNAVERKPACIYVHPWEVDPEQPRLASGLIARARTYTGLRGMNKKLARLVSEFRFSTLTHVCPSADDHILASGLTSG